jgi:hypothetical protein
MARGGRKTPPPHTHSPIVTRSHSDNNVTSQTTTTSNENPQITVEPVTPNPQGSDVQEIVRQSLLRTHGALARIRQPGRPLNQPLDFSDIREKLEGIGLLLNPTDPDHILTPAAEGSGIPPSPPHSSPSSSGEESSDEGSSSSQPSHHLHHLRPWKIQTIPPDLGSIKMLWPYLDPNTLCLNIQRNGYLNSIQTLSKSSRIT